MKILVIVFTLDPPYVDIGTPTRANDPWHSASSPTPRYIIIGLTPTTRRGSNRSSGRQSGVQEPIVVAASPPPTTSSASHLSISSMFPYYRLFSCLSFTVVIISRLLFCVRTVWQCLYVVRVKVILYSAYCFRPLLVIMCCLREIAMLWLVPDYCHVATSIFYSSTFCVLTNLFYLFCTFRSYYVVLLLCTVYPYVNCFFVEFGCGFCVCSACTELCSIAWRCCVANAVAQKDMSVC